MSHSFHMECLSELRLLFRPYTRSSDWQINGINHIDFNYNRKLYSDVANDHQNIPFFVGSRQLFEACNESRLMMQSDVVNCNQRYCTKKETPPPKKKKKNPNKKNPNPKNNKNKTKTKQNCNQRWQRQQE